MSNNKQWLPNKVEALSPKNISHPFDGTVITRDNKLLFQFTSPGLINNKIPNNMFSGSQLFSVNLPGTVGSFQKWFIIATCTFNVGITNVRLSMKTSEPNIPRPTMNNIPTSTEIILYAGFGSRSWKMVNGNVLLKPMLLLRNYKRDVLCGEMPFEDYYSFVSIS